MQQLQFLTAKEVADLMKVNLRTVRRWISAGKLPAVRIGRTVRVPLDELVKQLRGHQ